MKIQTKKCALLVPLFFLFALVFLLGLRGNQALGRDDAIAPRAPQFFSVETQNDTAILKWQENSEWDLFSYVIGIRTAAEKEIEDERLTGLRHSYTLEQLKPGERYFVSLAARDISGNVSTFTPEIGFIVPEEQNESFGLHGWIPATSDQLDSVVAFEKNREKFSSISPFEYALEDDGALSKRGDVFSDETVDRTRKEGVSIVPTITNNFDRNDKGTDVLQDSEKTNRLLDVIEDLVDKNGYDGIDIDFENLHPEVKDEFTSFITQLSERLHRNNKIVSATLQAKKSDTDDWPGVGSQDFEALGKAADQIRIMSYDFSRVNTAPGPIAPIRWYEKVLSYAVSKIDAHKVIAGVPTYAYRWCTHKNTDPCPTDALVWEGVKNIVEKYEPKVEWSGEYETPWFSYEDENKNEYLVYFENYQSIEAKMAVASNLGVGGAVIWRLGNEDPQNYEVYGKLLDKKVSNPHVSIEPHDSEISLTFLDADASRKGYRVTYSAKNEAERFVDVLGNDSYIIPGLTNDRLYTISISPKKYEDVTRDFFADTKSSFSTSQSIEFTAMPKDLSYPGTVEDVSIDDVGTNSIKISFSSTGDEYTEGMADHFEIRYADFPLSEENFYEAVLYDVAPRPLEAGERHEWELRSLEGGAHYYIGIKAFDEAGNVSDISSVVETTTIDAVPPHTPDVSAALGGDEEMEFIWKSNEEVDLSGYRIYFRTENGAYNVVDLGKNKNHVVIPGVENNRTYEMALAAVDINGNESDRSKDYKVVPRSGNSLTRFSEEVLLDKEKIQGSLYLFSDKLINERALPYLAMVAVIIVNIFIYYSFKGEIMRLVSRKQEPVAAYPDGGKKRIISDMKQR